jgi:nucleotide-binding universal stress UspA family protein
MFRWILAFASKKQYLEDMVQKLGKVSNVKVYMVNKEGHVPEVIKQHAAEVQADLVVMATHARGAMSRFWLGSVTDQLIRDLVLPLLLVHPVENNIPALDKEIAIKDIVVPLDGSPHSEGILAHVTDVAKAMGSSLTLVRVIKPLLPMALPMGAGSFGEMASHMTMEVESIQENLQKEAATYLDGIAARLRGQGFQVQTRIEVEEQPARAILNVKGSDLIAMETHGRRGLSRFFLGSVADKVLRGAQVPLLVAHPRS